MTLNLKIWNSLTPHPTVQVNATSVSSFPDRLDRRRLDTVHWRGSGSPPGSAAFGVGHSYHVGFDHELAWWHCTPCHFEPEWQRLDGTVLAEELVWSVLAAQLTYPMHHRFKSHYTGFLSDIHYYRVLGHCVMQKFAQSCQSYCNFWVAYVSGQHISREFRLHNIPEGCIHD